MHVLASAVIDAPLDAVWDLLKNFNNIAHWHPDVQACRMERDGTGRLPGEVRSITLRDGTGIREQLLAISDSAKRCSYSLIASPLPIRHHRSTVRLMAASGNRTAITWTADFTVAGGADAATIAADVKAGVMELGFEGLKAALRRSSRRASPQS